MDIKEQELIIKGYSGLRVVVTGGRGFLGRNLVRRLVELGSHVVVVDHSVPTDVQAISSSLEIARAVDFVRADIRDQGQMDRVVGQCDVLFSLAGKSGASDSVHDPFADLDVNCRGHLTLLEAARQRNPRIKIVFPSSRLVYGKIEYLPVGEDHPTEPTSVYGIHKLTAEKYYLLYNRIYGMQSTVLRLTNPFGPYQNINGRNFGVVNQFMARSVAGIPIQIFGDGTQLRDYLYIDDAIRAMLLAGIATAAAGEVFNVGSGQGISLAEMAELIAKISGKGKVVHVPWPTEYANVETGSFVADIQKIECVLGWLPETDMEQALSISLEHYRRAQSPMI